jgi:hypothetical protein
VAEEKEGVTIPILAPQQFLLDYLVLVGGKRARQIMLLAGYVLPKDQAGQSGEIFGPSQFLQHEAQMEQVDGIGHSGQRGLVGAQGGEPGQDVRIAAQLWEGLHQRVLGAEKIQEIADGAVVETNRLLVEGGGERLSGALKQRSYRMLEGRAPVHSGIGRVGRICCATARAYCSKTSWGEICT